MKVPVRRIHKTIAITTAFAAIAGVLGALSTNAGAQAYPSRPITLVVPFAPSGAVDAVGRVVASSLQSRLKQQVVVENRAGAGGYIGAEHVAKSNPDGYTLLLLGGSTLYSGLFNKSLATDIAAGLAPLASVGQIPLLALASATLPPRNMKDFVAHVKANPKRLNVGVIPNNTVHLDTVRLTQLANLEMTEIPYSNGGDATNALARGDVHLFVTALISAKSMIDAGKVIPLAVGGTERMTFMPDLPTLKEAGFDMLATTWFGVFGPLKLPAEVTSRIEKETNDAMEARETQEIMKKIFVSPFHATPAQMRALIAQEQKQYATLAQSAGLLGK